MTGNELRTTIHVGFTGTREVPTEAAQLALTEILLERFLPPSDYVLHHGNCEGADALAHCLTSELEERSEEPLWSAVLHPPLELTHQAHHLPFGLRGDIRPAEYYLDRNHRIVDETASLIAIPRTAHEERRSGTWATVRYARRRGRPLTLILPDGEVRGERTRT